MKHIDFFNIWKVLKKTGSSFVENDSMARSASIAFYTIFSLPAILIITVLVATTTFEQQVVQEELLHQITSLMGKSSAEEIKGIMENAKLAPSSSWAKIVGIATLMFSATTVFVSLQSAINYIWRIKPKPQRGIVKFVVNRLLSLAMVGSVGFLLMVSLVLDTLLILLNQWLTFILSDFAVQVISAINLVLSLGIIAVVFAVIFKVLPDAKVKWKHVKNGAIVTAILFSLGKYLIGFYLGNSDVGSAYGAAGSTVVLLIWVYYSVVILLFGAQFTFSYAEVFGNRIQPYDNAVKIEIKEVEMEKKSKERQKLAAS